MKERSAPFREPNIDNYFFFGFNLFPKIYIGGVESLERTFVALGSNIPPRGQHLSAAIEMLKRISLGGWKESSIYETPPVGPEGEGPYFNQVVTFWYGKGYRSLLNYLKGAELFLGRKPRGHWEKREIDMDLLYYGEAICKGRPTLPHPEAASRGFVLVPLVEIDPDWVDPLTGHSAKSMLLKLKVSGDFLDFPKMEVSDE